MKKQNFFRLISIISLLVALSFFFVSSVKAEPYGWSPSTDNSNQGPPVCTETYTRQAVLYQPNHNLLPKAKNRGEIRLWWHPTNEATSYNVYFGLTPKNYIYSAANIGSGETNNYTVQFLQNKKYYFAVQSNKGCASGPVSNEWWGKPLKGGYIASKIVKK